MNYEVLVLMAGRRWAKTQFGIYRLIEGTRKPNSTNWYVAPTRVQAKEIVWRRLIEVFPPSMIARMNETELFLDTKVTNARIAVKGADNEEGLLGSGVDELIIDEAQNLKPHIWSQVLRPMLVGRRGRATIIGTKRPRNWFRTLWRDTHYGEMPPGYVSVYYPSTSNPIVPQEEWIRVRKEVGEAVWVREFISDPLADDSGTDEIKYNEFNRKDHIVNYFDIPESWRVFRFLDWGRNHNSACLWAALSPKGNVYIYDELVVNGKSPEAVADLILQKTGKRQITTSIIDPSTRRKEADGISVFERMRKILGSLHAGRKEDKAYSGATLVKNYLRPVSGKPRLYIFPKCTGLLEELEGVAWDSTTNEDRTDALRYGIGFINMAQTGEANTNTSDEIPDGEVIEDNIRVTYRQGHILKIEPLKRMGGFTHGVTFNSLGEPV